MPWDYRQRRCRHCLRAAYFVDSNGDDVCALCYDRDRKHRRIDQLHKQYHALGLEDLYERIYDRTADGPNFLAEFITNLTAQLPIGVVLDSSVNS